MAKDTGGDDAKKKQKFTAARDIGAAVDAKYTPDFEDIVEAPKRVVAASSALAKRGKSTWGFSMPKKAKGGRKGLAYLQWDANYEHALRKARETYGKDSIQHLRYFADPRGDIKTAHTEVWQRFLRDYDYCVKKFRSVMVDTASELLDARKIAEYGRTSQIQQIFYGSIYADFRWMVKHALDNDANVLFVHRAKKEYQNNDWSGNYVLEGWAGIVYEAQVHVTHDRDEDGNFLTTVVDCGQDAMLNGFVFSSNDDEGNDFAALATKIYPDTTREEWE